MDGYETKLVLDKYLSTKVLFLNRILKIDKKILEKLNFKIYKNRFRILSHCISDNNSNINFYIDP